MILECPPDSLDIYQHHTVSNVGSKSSSAGSYFYRKNTLSLEENEWYNWMISLTHHVQCLFVILSVAISKLRANLICFLQISLFVNM